MSTTKPRKIPEATVKRIALEVAGIGGWLAARSSNIAKANEFLDDGRKGADYSRVKRGGAEGTSVEMAALAGQSEIGPATAFGPRDGIAKQATEFMGTLERWLRDGRRLRALGVNLGVEWTEDAKNAASFVAKREKGEGDCVNCKRFVPGEATDRLRHDRCEACARYWTRHDREKERPRHLWGSDSIDDRCPNQRTHHGIDRRCLLLWGHTGACTDEVGSFNEAGAVA